MKGLNMGIRGKKVKLEKNRVDHHGKSGKTYKGEKVFSAMLPIEERP